MNQPAVRRYQIAHRTHFTYAGAVTASHNEVRMTPPTTAGQTSLESRLRIRPLSWGHTYRDYFGTSVTAIEATGPHSELDIESISTVERYETEPREVTITWDELRDENEVDRRSEWLDPRARTMLAPEVFAWVGDQVAGMSPVEAVRRVIDITWEQLHYQAGVTGVRSSAQDAWEARKGVCQDFSHVAIGLLRHLGIPARYVSGYLTPKKDLEVGQEAVGESHAWVEWWGGSWLGVDPTNLRPVGLDHIVVARGRDYDDVPPFKGVYSGAPLDKLSVEVSITRLA